MWASSEFLISKSKQQKKYLQYLYGKFECSEIREVPEFAYEIKGLEKLKEVGRVLKEGSISNKEEKLLP